jgi:hypothetical protein
LKERKVRVDITEIGAAVTLTHDQFERHFLELGNGALEYLTKKCPAVETFNYDGHFGAYIFFRCEAKKFERAKNQVLKAIQGWMAINSRR